MAASAKTILSGANGLRSHLTSPSFSRFSRTGCLAIQSDIHSEGRNQSATTAIQSSPVVGDYVNESKFLISVELGMKSVQCTVSSAFPTVTAVHESIEFAKRSGVETIIGVGSGAAIDLAKAVAAATDAEQLILAPATLGSALASMSNESLLLSTKEEALLPYEKPLLSPCTIVLDPERIAFPFVSGAVRPPMGTVTVEESIIASLALALDSAFFRMPDAPIDDAVEAATLTKATVDNVKHTFKELDNPQIMLGNAESSKICRHGAVSAAMHAGQLIQLASGSSEGLIPSPIISLASAILPRFFPTAGIVPFLAALLPGLVKAQVSLVQTGNTNYAQLQSLRELAGRLTGTPNGDIESLVLWADELCKLHRVRSLSSLADGTPSLSNLMDKFDQYSSLLKLNELNEDTLGVILEASLNR